MFLNTQFFIFAVGLKPDRLSNIRVTNISKYENNEFSMVPNIESVIVLLVEISWFCGGTEAKVVKIPSRHNYCDGPVGWNYTNFQNTGCGWVKYFTDAIIHHWIIESDFGDNFDQVWNFSGC